MLLPISTSGDSGLSRCIGWLRSAIEPIRCASHLSEPTMTWYSQTDSWRFIFRRYLPRLAMFSLVWEVLQLPPYALASEPRRARIVYAVTQCTIGDARIGTAALIAALVICRADELAHWP